MTIRGGGNPNSAMAAMPLREWTRRLGALPVEAYHCFMVGVLWTQPITSVWRELPRTQGRLPSDHQSSRTRSLQRAAVLTSLTAAARVGFGILRSGRKKACGAVEQKKGAQESQEGKKGRAAAPPLTRKAPYKRGWGT